MRNKKIEKPELLIFDLDNTLVRSEFDMKISRRIIIDHLQEIGFDTSGITLNTPTQQILSLIKAQSSEKGIEFSSVKTKVYSILDTLETEVAKNAALFEDTINVLNAVRSLGIKSALLTNSGRKALEIILKNSGIGKFFGTILCRDDVEEMKPSPVGILKIIQVTNSNKEKTWHVGDSVYDVIAAKQCGVIAVSVESGPYGKDELYSVGADFVISKISDLVRYLRT